MDNRRGFLFLQTCIPIRSSFKYPIGIIRIHLYQFKFLSGRDSFLSVNTSTVTSANNKNKCLGNLAIHSKSMKSFYAFLHCISTSKHILMDGHKNWSKGYIRVIFNTKKLEVTYCIIDDWLNKGWFSWHNKMLCSH